MFLDVALGTAGFFYAVLTVLYLEAALRTRSLRKMIFYPILDITRGVVFTLGGLTQLIREMEEPEDWVTSKHAPMRKPPEIVQPILSLKKKDEKRRL